MTIQEFIQTYREAFGEAAPLPIAFGYSNTPATEVDTDGIPVKSVPKAPIERVQSEACFNYAEREEARPKVKCIIGAISKVRDGESLTLCREIIKCGGAGLYTCFNPMPERVPMFVSQIEHYKLTPEMVKEYVARLDIQITEKRYLNFVRIDKVENLDEMDGVIFFATPDILAGLSSWAFYDNNAPDAVSTQFASGCSSLVTFAVKENREGGRRCFLGMLDPSARLLVPKTELTLTIPTCRFKEMLGTMKDSALFQRAFSVVKKRINGEIQKD